MMSRVTMKDQSQSPEPLGLAPSFGFGDRLGIATPGHIAALREAGGQIRGVFAQQSIREMTRTGRTAGRQILHCTFGSVLTSEEFGPLVMQVLREYPNQYREVLRQHFVRHLDALNSA
jgi:hypothetical protein